MPKADPATAASSSGERPAAPLRWLPTRRDAWRAALYYAVVSALWIFFSGRLLHQFVHDEALAETLENVKGWCFVAVTSVLLASALDRYFRSIREAAAQFQEAEERLRLCGDNLPDSYVYQYKLLPDGKPQFTHISAGVQRVHGVSAEAVMKNPELLRAQIERAQWPQLAALEAESARTLQDFEMELTFRAEDGIPGRLHMRSRPHRTAHGEIHWDGMATNVTERKHAEEGLKLFRALIEQSSDEVHVLDPVTGRFLDFNATTCRALGYPREELLTLSVFDVTSGLAPKIFEAITSDAKGVAVAPFETVQRRRDGTTYPVEVNRALVKLERNYLVAIVRDISERKRAEAAFRESELRFRTLVETAPEAIFVCTNHQFSYLNPAALKLFGATSAAELLGGFPRDRVHCDSRCQALNFPQGVDEHGEPTIGADCLLVQLDGSTLHASISSAPITFEGQKSSLVFARDISDRIRAEEALREQVELQKQIAKIAATVPGVIYSFRLRPDGTMAMPFASAALADVYGLTPEQVRADASLIMASIHPDDAERVHDSIEASAASLTPWRQEFRTREQQRGEVWIEGHSVPQLEADGSVLWHGFLQDITNRRAADAALRASEERLKLALAAARMGVWEWNVRTNEVFWSPEAFQITGLRETQDPLNLDSFTSLVHPEDRDRVMTEVQASIANRTAFSSEFRVIRSDGALIWVNTLAGCAYDHAGQPLRVLGTVADITARQRTDDKLRNLSRAVEQSPVSIVITDTRGAIEYVNPKFTDVTGYTLAEALGKNPSILKGGATSPDQYSQLWQTILQGKTWRGEFENRRKNGEMFSERATISAVTDERGRITHYLAVKEDVTEFKQLEAQLRQAQKMEAIGQLAGGVAHDFNNILAVIMMQAELASLPGEGRGTVEEGLKVIRASAQRAANLTRQLLLFSRRQTLQPQNLDLNEVVASIAKMLQRIIGEDVQLQLNLAPGTLLTHADAGMLDQVLLNLSVNARDAMSQGGQLTISTSTVTVDESIKRSQPDAEPGRYLCLRVTDTGCGIPPEILPRIFEPFFTTKEIGKGTGLGLATVFGIVKQHHGWVDVESKLGVGTAFQVYLPALQAGALSESTPVAKPKPRGGSETILVAEDDPCLRALTRITLERKGYHVLAAADGGEAVELWQKHAAEISLLLTDLVMPGPLSGLQLSRRLRAERPGLRVIFTSGYSAEIAGRELELRLGENFVQKPSTPDHLLEVVRQSLDA